jgi:hypothetical protein
LVPESGNPNSEEAITGTELGRWMAAPIDGQFLLESGIFQGQIAAKFEDGNECRNEGK